MYDVEVRKSVYDKFFKLINDEKITKRLEKGLYNFIIDIAENENIVKKWDNIIFKNMYLQKA